MDRKVFELQDAAACPVIYDGPLRKLRPFVKYGLIAFWAIDVLISAVILHEEPVGQAVMRALPVTLICLAWLWPTRARTEWQPTPVHITLGTDALVWDFPAMPVMSRGRVIWRHEQYTMPRSEIESLHYQAQVHRISVWGTVHSKIWELDPDGNPKPAPCFQKSAKKAGQSVLLERYNPPGTIQQVLTALSKYTGRDVQWHGGS